MVSLSRCSAQLPVVLPVALQCTAARGATHRAAMCCCLWCRLLHCPSRRHELLPVASPVAPWCAGVHCVTRRAAVCCRPSCRHHAAVRCCSWCCLSRCCCPWCRLSCCRALLPWCHPSSHRALLPVMPLVVPVRAAAHRTVCCAAVRCCLSCRPSFCPSFRCTLLLSCCLSCHRALLAVIPPVALVRAAARCATCRAVARYWC